MSSILDALEKASKERAARKGDVISTDAVGQQAAVEKRLREEREHHRKTMQRAWLLMGGLAILLLIGTAGVWYVLFRSAPPRTAVETVAATQPAPSPSPATEPIAAAVKPEPTPNPTPAATPKPEKTAEPAKTVVPAETAVVAVAAKPTPFNRKISAKFKNGQVIHPSDVGLDVGGVLELSSGFIALINDKQIRKGQSVNDIRVTDIGFGQVMLDLGDGVVVRARF